MGIVCQCAVVAKKVEIRNVKNDMTERQDDTEGNRTVADTVGTFEKWGLWGTDRRPLSLDYPTLSLGIAILSILSFLGFFNLTIRLVLTALIQDSEYASTISTVLGQLLRLSIVIVFVFVNKGNLHQFYIQRNPFKLNKDNHNELKILLIGIVGLVIYSPLFAFYKIGTISFMPVGEYPSTIMSALYYGIVEEIEFRGILFVYLTYWLSNRIKDETKLRAVSIIVTSLIFGPLYHNRYFLTDIVLLITVSIFGLLMQLIVLRFQSLNAAWMLHALLDIIPFIFIAGAVTTL